MVPCSALALWGSGLEHPFPTLCLRAEPKGLHLGHLQLTAVCCGVAAWEVG